MIDGATALTRTPSLCNFFAERYRERRDAGLRDGVGSEVSTETRFHTLGAPRH